METSILLVILNYWTWKPTGIENPLDFPYETDFTKSSGFLNPVVSRIIRILLNPVGFKLLVNSLV